MNPGEQLTERIAASLPLHDQLVAKLAALKTPELDLFIAAAAVVAARRRGVTTARLLADFAVQAIADDAGES